MALKFAISMRMLLIAALGLGSAVDAAAKGSIEPVGGLQAYELMTLDSGFRLLVGKTSRKVAAVDAVLIARAGTDYGPPGLEGISTDVAEAAFMGRTSVDGETIRRRLADNGISLDVNVGRRIVLFQFVVPPTRLASFFQLLASSLGRESLPTDALAQARLVTTREALSKGADPWFQSAALLNKMVWSGVSRSAARPANPIWNSGEGDTDAACQNLWRSQYSMCRTALCICGDVEIGPVQEMAKRYLSAAARSEVERTDQPELSTEGSRVPPARRMTSTCMRMPAAEPPILLIGDAVTVINEKEFYELQVLTYVLGGSSASRLNRRLRNELGLVYTVEAECIPVGRNGVTLRIGCQTKQLGRVKEAIISELQSIAKEGISVDELSRAIQVIRSRIIIEDETPIAGLARLGQSVLDEQAARRPWEGARFLGKISVRDLRTLAREIFKPDNLATVVASGHPEAICSSGQKLQQN